MSSFREGETKEDLSYEEWMMKLNHYAAKVDHPPCDPNNSGWRDCYEMSDTPKEAMDLQLSYA